MILEWKKTDILSLDLASFKKFISDFAAEKVSESELTFLKANPEAAASELFLRSCKPMLESGIENANWSAIQETIKASIKQFYLADLSEFGPDMIKPLLKDVYFCASARRLDQPDLVGFLLFSITPALPFGDVKVINFFTQEESPNVRNSLMSLVFSILPQTKRIFLFTRPTDAPALEMYAAMGFEKDENPFEDLGHKINRQYLTTLNYRIENSKILQMATETMKYE
ncbi:MAG: hypothetical protein HY324_01200 [Chlamydiia bacterium]|nr:hypothetical protein [Chlamydiia bacterium]